MHHLIERLWYRPHALRWILFPITVLYCGVVFFRRMFLQTFRQHRFSVPIIVVGNLTVGGVGKTPLVIALAKALQARGLRVGIVSRGYGSQVNRYPYEVTKDAMASLVGDEPLLLARKTNCPVVIAPKRTKAVQYLLDNYQSQVIISDDGLQHYAMGRAIEIVVIDGHRGFGNGHCLPGGPLRERIRRLKKADFIVVNGSQEFKMRGVYTNTWYRMDLLPGEITQLRSGKCIPVTELKQPIVALAAIGHPQRFFDLLKTLGLLFKPYPLADHYPLQSETFNFKEKEVVMTEKDAVKCLAFATDSMYYLPVEAKIDEKFWDALWSHKQLQR